ncbi:ATP-binding cassette domain-containing protein [Flavobacterium antarcticum]|uniref:ABC transporter ATP-binding protein n=1 Tax=Flavobacterium antarcticum TaxID=271155 RepID=UPI0003B35CA0|nr:ABC transporter ATP-binding protein [Flavobacterium antarcticum]
MNAFQLQFEQIVDYLKYDDFAILTKRIIDLTLDTESVAFYQKTNDLLDWLDSNSENIPEKKIKFQSLLDELFAFLSQKEIPESKLLVSVTALEKIYPSGRFSLGPVNLNLHHGEILGLVGENGNGKTTLLRLLCGELFSTSGELNYHFQYDDLYDLRTQLVYIPQRTETWYGSVFTNLEFAAASYGYKPNENVLVVNLIMARLGLRKFRDYGWKDLSSGFKMRLELAHMLLRKPKILLIDEPLANLDILAQQTILEDFKAISKSPFRPIGIVLSSQQLYEVEKTSDQVIFLKNGSQKNLYENRVNENDAIEVQNFIYEFETEWTKNQLIPIFERELIDLQINGGVYIATCTAALSPSQFLQMLTEHNVPIQYYRNISNSTRRFFIS